MKKSSLVSVVLLLATSTLSWATVINFDDAPVGAISDFYRSQGVLFSTVVYNSATNTITDVAPFACIAKRSDIAVSVPNMLVAVHSTTDVNVSQNAVLISFVLPGTNIPAVTNNVKIYPDTVYNEAQADYVNMFALGADGQILAVDGIFDTEAGPLSITRSVADIASVIIAFHPVPRGSDVEYYDNLSFNTPEVPEPMTIAMLILGSLAMVVRKKA